MKPQVVIGSMEEFSKPQYKVDVLKVEVPINANYVEGSSVYKGQKAYSRERSAGSVPPGRARGEEAVHLFERGRRQCAVRGRVEHGGRSGHGLLGRVCAAARRGRTAFRFTASKGVKALEDWLSTEGVKNIEAVNTAIKPAKPWYAKAGVHATA